MSINETVLEMHFHKPLMDLIRANLGLGPGHFNFYKYSPQKECFVGFDQAFVRTDLSEDDLFDQLKSSAKNRGYNLSNFFIGFFLQYKVVKMMKNITRHTPYLVNSKPHYRISIDSKKNINTGFSQHELLFNLNKNLGVMVYYACPMLFDRCDLYNQEPNLNLLRLADLECCLSDYSDNESHFIYFKDINTDPVWCSEPVVGKALSPEEMIEKIRGHLDSEKSRLSQLELLEELKRPVEIGDEDTELRVLDLVSDSLLFVKYSSNDD